MGRPTIVEDPIVDVIPTPQDAVLSKEKGYGLDYPGNQNYVALLQRYAEHMKLRKDTLDHLAVMVVDAVERYGGRFIQRIEPHSQVKSSYQRSKRNPNLPTVRHVVMKRKDAINEARVGIILEARLKSKRIITNHSVSSSSSSTTELLTKNQGAIPEPADGNADAIEQVDDLKIPATIPGAPAAGSPDQISFVQETDDKYQRELAASISRQSSSTTSQQFHYTDTTVTVTKNPPLLQVTEASVAVAAPIENGELTTSPNEERTPIITTEQAGLAKQDSPPSNPTPKSQQENKPTPKSQQENKRVPTISSKQHSLMVEAVKRVLTIPPRYVSDNDHYVSRKEATERVTGIPLQAETMPKKSLVVQPSYKGPPSATAQAAPKRPTILGPMGVPIGTVMPMPNQKVLLPLAPRMDAPVFSMQPNALSKGSTQSLSPPGSLPTLGSASQAPGMTPASLNAMAKPYLPIMLAASRATKGGISPTEPASASQSQTTGNIAPQGLSTAVGQQLNTSNSPAAKKDASASLAGLNSARPSTSAKFTPTSTPAPGTTPASLKALARPYLPNTGTPASSRATMGGTSVTEFSSASQGQTTSNSAPQGLSTAVGQLLNTSDSTTARNNASASLAALKSVRPSTSAKFAPASKPAPGTTPASLKAMAAPYLPIKPAASRATVGGNSATGPSSASRAQTTSNSAPHGLSTAVGQQLNTSNSTAAKNNASASLAGLKSASAKFAPASKAAPRRKRKAPTATDAQIRILPKPKRPYNKTATVIKTTPPVVTQQVNRLNQALLEQSIPPQASCVFHVFDRRINFDAHAADASLYSLIRSWVQDDPHRYQTPRAGLIEELAGPADYEMVSKDATPGHADAEKATRRDTPVTDMRSYMRQRTSRPHLDCLRADLIRRAKKAKRPFVQALAQQDKVAMESLAQRGIQLK